MELDHVFGALNDPTRRRLLEELRDRDGQTLFELHVRLINWHGAALSRQALSKHLQVLEGAGLVRAEWRWRSKHHYFEPGPLKRLIMIWLGPMAERECVGHAAEDCRNEYSG